MTPNQLGNVLIKMLGLSVCIRSLPAIAGGISTLLQLVDQPPLVRGPMWWHLARYVIWLLIGLCLIVGSQRLANTFFKAQQCVPL
jgi:hypothetical protein